MYAYSQDLRDRVLAGLERRESAIRIAERLEVSRAWVYQVRDQLKKHGRRSSIGIGGHRVSRIASLEAIIRGWIDKEPDLTLEALCERLRRKHEIEIKIPALWHQLNKWGLSYKKNSARGRAAARRRAKGAASVEGKPSSTR